MSVGDLFKPIWKNSNSAARLQYVNKIAKSSGYSTNAPSVIKVLRYLAIFDPEEEVSQLALSLLTDPKILKETVLKAPTATQKFALIQQIEVNTAARINDIDTNEVPEFLNLVKDEKLTKDLLILHPQHLALGFERIIHEENIVEIIERLNLADLSLAQTFVELAGKVLGKINSYNAFQRIETHLNKELQDKFKSGTENSNKEITAKLEKITENIKKKITALPEYHEEVKKQALLTEANEFNQKLNDELLNIESLVNTPVSEVDHVLTNQANGEERKEPSSPESILAKWNELKTKIGEGNLEMVPVSLKTDEIINRYQNTFQQWLTLRESGKRFLETFNRLTALVSKTSILVPEAIAQNFNKPEHFKLNPSESENSHNHNLVQALSAHQEEWSNTLAELSRLSDKTPKLEEHSAKFNDEVEKAHNRIIEIKALLSKQHTVYQQTKKQLENITDETTAVITEVVTKIDEAAKLATEQPPSSTPIANKIKKMEEQWQQTIHEELFSPELASELFNDEQENFNNSLKKIKKILQELEHKRQKFQKEHLAKLNQELKAKTDHTEQVLSDHKGKDGKKVDKKLIRDLSHELHTFEKNFTPFSNELNADLIKRFKDATNSLKAVVGEIEEDFTRLQSINLQKKEKICEVLESLNEVEDKAKLAFLLREAEIKWKNMGSVDRNVAESIQNRFNEIVAKLSGDCEQALGELDKKIATEVSIKENLITELEAFTNSIATTEQGWRGATNHINTQIEKWKEIKILSHEQNLQLNINFKKELDRFYERRNVFYNELKSKHGPTIESKRKLLAEAKKLAEQNASLPSQAKEGESGGANTEWFKLRTRLIKLTEEWYKLGAGFPYNENNKLNDDLNEVYESILSSHKEDLEGRKARKTKLLVTLQEINKALAGKTDNSVPGKPEVSKTPELAEKTDKAEKTESYTKDDNSTADESHTTQTAVNTSAENKQDLNTSTPTKTEDQADKTTSDEATQIANLQKIFNTKREWDRIAPILGRGARKLNSDFYNTYRKILQDHRKLINKFDQDKQASLQKKEALLKELETVLASEKDSKALTQSVIDIQSRWKQAGRTPQRKDSIKIEKTFYHLTNQFFKEKKANYQKFQDQRKQNYPKKMEILTRVRYLVEGSSAVTGTKTNNSITEEEKNKSKISSNIINSPEQLKVIWEMNRQLRNTKENSSSKQNIDRAVRDELRSLREQWKNIGPTNSDRALNDEFFALLRKAHS